jgi:hypothetical protein
MGFVSEHPFFGSPTLLTLLPADFLCAGSFRRDSTGLKLFDFVQQ